MTVASLQCKTALSAHGPPSAKQHCHMVPPMQDCAKCYTFL